jgi:hypothetical protein
MGSKLIRPIGCKAAKAVKKERCQSSGRRGMHHGGSDQLMKATEEAGSNFDKMRELMHLNALSGRHDKAEEIMKRTMLEACIGDAPVVVDVKVEKDVNSPSAPGPISVVDIDLDVTTDDPSTLTKTDATVAPTIVSNKAYSVNLLRGTDDTPTFFFFFLHHHCYGCSSQRVSKNMRFRCSQ